MIENTLCLTQCWFDLTVWRELFVGVLSGLVSSIISSIITKQVIENCYEFKKVKKIFYFQMQDLRDNFSVKSVNDIIDILNLGRRISRRDNKFKKLFKPFDIDLTTVVNLKKSGGNATYEFNNDDYFNLMNYLERSCKNEI